MPRLLLIRHAENDYAGRAYAGRLPDVHLNEQGRQQAERLAAALTHEPIQHIFSSPLERTRETAEPLARRLNLEVQLAEALTEIDLGAWTGRSFADLAADPTWQRFNAYRSGTRVPGGELMLEAQVRVVVFLQDLCTRHPGATLAVVAHADVIRAALLYYLGMSIDLFHRLEISPASVSVLDLEEHGPIVRYLNRTVP